MIDIFSHKKIARHLEQYNSLFRTFWDLGEVSFLEDEQQKKSIPTAAILFDKKSGDPIQFVFNKDFWDSIDDTTRTFVICHEMLHIFLRHGKRLVELRDNQLANVAMDLSVNQLLISRFGISRKKLQDDDKYIWIDTVFKPEDQVLPGQNFEYYYNLLQEKFPPQSMGLQDLLDKLKSGKIKFVDSHYPGEADGTLTLPDAQSLTDQEKDILDEIKKFINESDIDDSMREVDKMAAENTKNADSRAGSGTGGWLPIFNKPVKQKFKWIKAANKWRQKLMVSEFVEKDNWVFHNRKYEDFMASNHDCFFQTDGRILDVALSKKKLNISLFLDISGSCVQYADRFWTAYKSIPKKFFEVKLYTFDTNVAPIDPKKDKIYGGGGTRFDIIEAEVRKGHKYPDHVWVITDGHGGPVSPKYPERWTWFLTDGHSTTYINSKSKIFKLNEFE